MNYIKTSAYLNNMRKNVTSLYCYQKYLQLKFIFELEAIFHFKTFKIFRVQCTFNLHGNIKGEREQSQDPHKVLAIYKNNTPNSKHFRYILSVLSFQYLWILFIGFWIGSPANFINFYCKFGHQFCKFYLVIKNSHCAHMARTSNFRGDFPPGLPS